MSVIRVALVARPAAGGIRRHVSSLVSRLNRGEFAPALFAPRDFHLDPPSPDCPRTVLPIAARNSPLADLRAILVLSRLLRGRYDLVHAHGLRGAAIGIPAARLARIPAVFTAHNLVPPCGPIARAVLQALGRNAEAIAVSRAVAATLTTLGLDAGRIHVIPNGVDVADFDKPFDDETSRRRALADLIETTNQTDSRVRAHWIQILRGSNESLFVVGAVGRLSPEKGFDVLISAVTRATQGGAASDSQPLLILGGSGPEENRLRAMTDRAPNIVLAGPIANVASLFAACDVVAIPSRSEGQGIVALEAMAARKPVIAARVGGLIETVVDGETGLLVPPEDPNSLAQAIGALLQSPELCYAMGQRGRERVERDSTLDRMVDRLSDLYRRTVRSHDSRRRIGSH